MFFVTNRMAALQLFHWFLVPVGGRRIIIFSHLDLFSANASVKKAWIPVKVFSLSSPPSPIISKRHSSQTKLCIMSIFVTLVRNIEQPTHHLFSPGLGFRFLSHIFLYRIVGGCPGLDVFLGPMSCCRTSILYYYASFSESYWINRYKCLNLNECVLCCHLRAGKERNTCIFLSDAPT